MRSPRRNQREAHSVCLGAPDGQGPDLWGRGERQVFCKSQSQWDALSTAGIFKPGQSIFFRRMEYNAGEFRTTLLHLLMYSGHRHLWRHCCHLGHCRRLSSPASSPHILDVLFSGSGSSLLACLVAVMFQHILKSAQVSGPVIFLTSSSCFLAEGPAA